MKTVVKAMIENALSLGATIDDIFVVANEIRARSKDSEVQRWIRERCELSKEDSTKPADLYDNYLEWCGTLSPVSKQTFGTMLRGQGFLRKLKTDGWHWCGLALAGCSVVASVDAWIVERCEVHPRASLRMKDLYDDYVVWGGVAPKSSFNKILADRGYVRVDFVWYGLTTKAALVTARQQLQELQK